ncbi:hypothetical protein BAY59_21465 [Prauserella coralliicola]|nr:hypothetical protein BAY59_21465 [Prauserella coralliicola]
MEELLPEPLVPGGFSGSVGDESSGGVVESGGGVVEGGGVVAGGVVGSGGFVVGLVVGGSSLSEPPGGVLPGRVLEEVPLVGVMTVVVVMPSGPTLTTVVGEVVAGGSVPVTATPSTMICVWPGMAWPGTSSGPPLPPELPVLCEAVRSTASVEPGVPPMTCATAPNAVASRSPLAASAM